MIILAIGLAVPAEAETPLQVAAEYESPTEYFDTESTLDTDIEPTNFNGDGALLVNQSREGTTPNTQTYEVESNPEVFNVMVPTSLYIHIDSDGNITTANGEEIINNSSIKVEVTNIQVATMNGWSLCEWGTSWEDSGVDIKEFSMQLNENSVSTDGTCGLLGFGEIPASGSQTLSYTARVAPQSQAMREQIAQVIFTISRQEENDILTPLTQSSQVRAEPMDIIEESERNEDQGEQNQDQGAQPDQTSPDTEDSEQYVEETYSIPEPYVLTTETEESKVYTEPSNNGELKRQALKTPTREWIETECCHPGDQVIQEEPPILAADSFNFDSETGRFILVNPVEYNTNTILTRAYAMNSEGDLIEMVEVKTEEERVFIRCTQEDCENYQREFEALETYDWLYYRPYTVN